MELLVRMDEFRQMYCDRVCTLVGKSIIYILFVFPLMSLISCQMGEDKNTGELEFYRLEDGTVRCSFPTKEGGEVEAYFDEEGRLKMVLNFLCSDSCEQRVYYDATTGLVQSVQRYNVVKKKLSGWSYEFYPGSGYLNSYCRYADGEKVGIEVFYKDSLNMMDSFVNHDGKGK